MQGGRREGYSVIVGKVTLGDLALPSHFTAASNNTAGMLQSSFLNMNITSIIRYLSSRILCTLSALLIIEIIVSSRLLLNTILFRLCGERMSSKAE